MNATRAETPSAKRGQPISRFFRTYSPRGCRNQFRELNRRIVGFGAGCAARCQSPERRQTRTNSILGPNDNGGPCLFWTSFLERLCDRGCAIRSHSSSLMLRAGGNPLDALRHHCAPDFSRDMICPKNPRAKLCFSVTRFERSRSPCPPARNK